MHYIRLAQSCQDLARYRRVIDASSFPGKKRTRYIDERVFAPVYDRKWQARRFHSFLPAFRWKPPQRQL
jgi:hypothetical protein